MNLLTLRIHEGGAVYAIIDNDTMDKIQSYDVKREHHTIGNFSYVHREDRRNYALSLLGFSQDPTEPIVGDSVIVVFHNSIVELPEQFAKCKRMYIL